MTRYTYLSLTIFACVVLISLEKKKRKRVIHEMFKLKRQKYLFTVMWSTVPVCCITLVLVDKVTRPLAVTMVGFKNMLIYLDIVYFNVNFVGNTLCHLH